MASQSVPSVLSDRARAELLIGQLYALEQEAFQVRSRMQIEGREANEVYEHRPDGDPLTYGGRLDAIEAGRKKVWEENKDVHDEVKKVLAERNGA